MGVHHVKWNHSRQLGYCLNELVPSVSGKELFVSSVDGGPVEATGVVHAGG